MKNLWIRKLFIIVGLVTLTACIQMPTESAQTVDNRPVLMFKAESVSYDYRVLVDGLDMGNVESYLTGENSLRVLSGSHVVTIKHDDIIVQQQKVYLGDGTSKTIVVVK